MTDEELINAVAGLPVELRGILYAFHQRIAELEADNKTLRLSIGVGRWAGPMIVAIVMGTVTLVVKS